MTKTVRAGCTLEFKHEAVRLVHGGQGIAPAARTLGVVEQTLFNWVKADRQGTLSGADSKVVSTEQIEIRQVVGWSPQAHMQTALVKDAVLMACFRRRPPADLIFHSDRGS